MMKPIHTTRNLMIIMMLLLPVAAVAQQGTQVDDKPAVKQQAGKGVILQFHTPETADSLKGKGITLGKKGKMSRQEARQIEGQHVRIVTTPEGDYRLEIIHPDSAAAERRRVLEVMEGRAEAPEQDVVAEFLQRQKQTVSQEEYELPLRIRTEGRPGNRLEIILENNTGQPLTGLQLSAKNLPEGWKTYPALHEAEAIPARGSDAFTFQLEAPAKAGAENISFQLRSEEILKTWTARVEPAAAEGEAIPEEFELHGNYPNPFNPTTTISYALPEAMQVKVEVYNLIGQRVAMLVNQRQTAGTHNIVWDASRSASGTYLYRVSAVAESGEFLFDEKKLTLIK